MIGWAAAAKSLGSALKVTRNDELRPSPRSVTYSPSRAVQLAEATSSYSTSAVHCCAHSEQLNVSCSRPDVPVRAISYSHIARPQLGHAGVLPTGCSDDLNKLDWGIASLSRTSYKTACIGLPRIAGIVGGTLVPALGQMQTFCAAEAISALPPRADIGQAWFFRLSKPR